MSDHSFLPAVGLVVQRLACGPASSDDSMWQMIGGFSAIGRSPVAGGEPMEPYRSSAQRAALVTILLIRQVRIIDSSAVPITTKPIVGMPISLPSGSAVISCAATKE